MLFAAAGLAQGPISLYVDKNSQATAPTGYTDWTNAFLDLQSALDLAASVTSVGGYRIVVADGIYLPSKDAAGNSAVPAEQTVFSVPAGVSLHGGFLGYDADPVVLAGRSIDWNAPDGSYQNTILSGDHGGGIHSYTVVTTNSIQSETWIDGFLITGGRASGAVDSISAVGSSTARTSRP
jgi:hypothetical protein